MESAHRCCSKGGVKKESQEQYVHLDTAMRYSADDYSTFELKIFQMRRIHENGCDGGS